MKTLPCSLRVTCWLVAVSLPRTGQAAPPPELRQWLAAPQAWVRDTPSPIVSLGDPGQFDDSHIFAPAVALTGKTCELWYCGSTGEVARRVFRLGLATGPVDQRLVKNAANPVCQFGDDNHSVLTPTLLRRPDGSALRENGRLRMWFSSTWFGEIGRAHV